MEIGGEVILSSVRFAALMFVLVIPIFSSSVVGAQSVSNVSRQAESVQIEGLLGTGVDIRLQRIEESLTDLSLIRDHLEGIRNSSHKSAKRLIDIRLLLILLLIVHVVILFALFRRSSPQTGSNNQSFAVNILSNFSKHRVLVRSVLIVFISLSVITLGIMFFFL